MQKVCSKCLAEKPLDEFYVDNNPKNKTKRQSRCKDCSKAASIEKYASLSDAEYLDLLSYHCRIRKENPERTREWDAKKLAKRGPERVRKEHGIRMRRWRALNPDKVAQHNAERRLAVGRMPGWGNPEMIALVYKKAAELGLEVDHIVPLKSKRVSGLHVWWNLQLLDHAHNKAKNNRTWPDMP